MFLGDWAALHEFANNVLIIVMQGLFHGFVLLPLALSTFGADHVDDIEGAEEEAAAAAAAAAAQADEDNAETEKEDQDDEEATSPVHSPVDLPSEQHMFEEEEAGTDQQQNSRKSSKRSKKKKKGGREKGEVAFENPVAAFEDD